MDASESFLHYFFASKNCVCNTGQICKESNGYEKGMLETSASFKRSTKPTVVTELIRFPTHPGGDSVPDMAHTIVPVFMQLESKQRLA